MLRQFSQKTGLCQGLDEASQCAQVNIQNPYARDLKKDLKLGIDALFEFSDKLNDLHPEVALIIESFLAQPRSNW